MNIIKNKNLVVYYYSDMDDLLKEEKTFENLHIGLSCNGVIKICPRGDTWHILLLNSGNRESDKKMLQEALGRFGKTFDGEL